MPSLRWWLRPFTRPYFYINVFLTLGFAFSMRWQIPGFDDTNGFWTLFIAMAISNILGYVQGLRERSE